MKLWMKCAVACGLLLGTGSVLAQDYGIAGTFTDGLDYGLGNNADAGETVSNTATVNYEINGVAQQAAINSPAATFVVDRVILIHVENMDASNTYNTSASATDAFLTFEVTNNSNVGDGTDASKLIDLALSVHHFTDDDFNAGSLTFWVDGGDGVFDEVDDINITGTMRLANMTENETRTVYVRATMPSTAMPGGVTENDISAIALIATAHENAGNGGGIITATAGSDDPAVMDTVFGDPQGTYYDDGDIAVGLVDDLARDGRHSDTGNYKIGAATITVTKTSVVLDDPFNGDQSPKAIPGATVLYCITITNSGTTDATDVAISDPIPDNTTYVPGSIMVFDSAVDCDAGDVGTEAATGGIQITDVDTDDANEATTNDTDHGIAAYGNSDGGNTVLTTVPTVPANDGTNNGVTSTVFRVTID